MTAASNRISAIRSSLGLSRAKFADRFELDIDTVYAWETRRRTPRGAARAYLAVIEHEPEAVMRALERARWDASPVIEWFEVDDDGYPTEESLERLRKHRFETMREAAHFLIHDFPAIADLLPYSACQIEPVLDRFEKATWIVEFHTRGWSGCEALIAAALTHLWAEYLHWHWQRGGHYWFKVPCRLLAGPSACEAA